MKRSAVTIAVTVLLALGLSLVWSLGGSPEVGIDEGDPTPARGGRDAMGPGGSGATTEGGVRQRWLPAARAYTASIVDLDEKPVIGLKLELGREPHLQSVETDERGRFTFHAGASGAEKIRIAVRDPRWMLVDWMDRKGLESLELPADREKVIELRVHPMLFLAGRVLDDKGAAVALAQILMSRDPSWRGELLPATVAFDQRTWNELRSTETSDRQGRFRIAMPVGAPVRGVKARTESAQESEIQDLAAWWKDPGSVITLQLQRLGQIQGRILFVGMKKPKYVTVALRRKQKPAERSDQGSVQVRLLGATQSSYARNPEDREWKQIRMINATEDHRYLLEDLLPGTYQVHFSYYVPAPRSKVEETSVLPGVTRTLDVTIGPEAVGPTTELTASVVDQEGRGIDGMRIRAWQDGTPMPRTGHAAPQRPFHASVLTDAQGRFALTTPESVRVRLCTSRAARRTGPFTVYGLVQKVVKAGTKGYRIQVSSLEAGVIQGRVLFPNGNAPDPGSSAKIMLKSMRVRPAKDPKTGPEAWGEAASRMLVHRSDPKTGVFSIQHVLPGEYRIMAACSDFGILNKTVSVTAGQVTPVLFQFETPPALRGQVVDGKGRPAPKVKLWTNMGFEAVKARGFANPTATTDAAGRFEIPGLGKWGSDGQGKRGVYLLAYEEGYAPLTLLVKTAKEARQLRLVLRREGSLYVRHLPVTGAAFGLSFDKAILYHLNLKAIDPVTRKLSDVLWRPYTPGMPHVRFPDIAAGDYQLLLQVLPPKHKRGKPLPSLWRRVRVEPGDVTTVDWRKLHK